MTALSTFPSSTFPVVDQGFSGPPSFGILSTYPPTPCGLATFSAALADGLGAHGADVSVVRVADGSPSSSARVIGELVNGSAASVAACADLLNRSDVAVIQHEYGIYGGVDGDEVVDVIDGLHVPSIVVAHTILKDPTPHQRSVLEAIAARRIRWSSCPRRPGNGCASASTSTAAKSPPSRTARPCPSSPPVKRPGDPPS